MYFFQCLESKDLAFWTSTRCSVRIYAEQNNSDEFMMQSTECNGPNFRRRDTVRNELGDLPN